MRDIFSSRIDLALIFRESVHRRWLLLPSIELPSLAYIASAPTTRKGFPKIIFNFFELSMRLKRLVFLDTSLKKGAVATRMVHTLQLGRKNLQMLLGK